MKENLLEQLNLPLSTKENGVDFIKEMRKIGEVYDLICNRQLLLSEKYD